MRRHLLIIYVVLAAAWLAFSAWQLNALRRQRDLVEESLRQQSHSILTAVVGGISSHRRVGWYFEEQLQAMLDAVAESSDVVSIVVSGSDDKPLLTAGAVTQAATSGAWESGPEPVPLLRTSESFELRPLPPGSGGGGGGGGGGWGRGFGARRGDAMALSDSPFASGGRFRAELSINRSRADELIRQAQWSQGLALIAAGLVALSLGMVFRAAVKLTEARGQADLYSTEARHLRDLSQAAAGLAHETRNPLGLIRGWTQRLAQADVTTAQRQEHAQAVMEECDRVTARINQFLAFARPREPRLDAVDMPTLLGELAAILQPDLEATRLTLQWDVAPAMQSVQADFELLRQALFNLLQNAIQFSPAGAAIDVSVNAAGSHLGFIRVADRGPGVPSESVESLFTPYFTTRAEGTGLGLAIVRHLVALHGWQVAYSPREGGGAVFEIGGMHGSDANHSHRR